MLKMCRMNQDETFDLRPSSLPGCGWRCGSTAQDVAGVQKKSLYMAQISAFWRSGEPMDTVLVHFEVCSASVSYFLPQPHPPCSSCCHAVFQAQRDSDMKRAQLGVEAMMAWSRR